jgi:alkanesulfonate monooxygenase SsuD/methylene tetrahydromethanopterin reductase-like flavin-dependent oxidoreductase (luciferase family)
MAARPLPVRHWHGLAVEETELMGGDFEHRWTQTREAIEVMKALWTHDEAEYHGRYFNFPPVRSFPKPAQQPHPPVILGGHAKNVLRRVVAHADGWLPNRITPAEIEKSRGELDAMAKEAGRDPRSISISVYGQLPDRTIVQALLSCSSGPSPPRTAAKSRSWFAQLTSIACRWE